MTLNDLKTGMIVTWRNGRKATVLRDTIYFKIPLSTSKSFLVTSSGDSWTSLTNPYDCFDYERNDFHSEVVWEDKPTVKMTVAEIEKKLGYKIEIVSDNEEEE